MQNIELEEGEAFLQDDDDDDEHIDPDRDFSYIDRKLEIFLGHYQKDFMRGYSADCMGPIFGGYGSFLPVQQRSAPILSNQRSQSHASPKFTPNIPSEKPTAATYASLPARTVPASSNQSVQFLSESGISTVNSQLKVKNSTECASNHNLQPKKPLLHHSEQNSLKFRVKMASKSVLSRDNSAIYSGLGLDMSPSSSPESTPLENDGTLPGLQEMNLESPSYIVKIMTSTSLPNEALMSPLHDDLICLMELENTLETGLPRTGQAEPLNILHEIKPKLKDTNKEKNSKQKEASKEMKPKQNTIRQKPAELVKENGEFPANSSDLSAIKREEIRTSISVKTVSNTLINAVDACSKETCKVSQSRPKDDAAVVEERNAIKLTNKTEKGKNIIAIPKDEPGADKRNEFGHREDKANKFLKQHSAVKDKVKEENFDSLYPMKGYGYRKESGKHEKAVEDKELGVVFEKEVKDHNKHYDIPQDINHNKSLKKMPYAKAMPPLQKGPSLEEPSSSLVKKKLKDFQTGNVSSTEQPRGSVVTSSGAEYEDVISKKNLSLSKKGDIDLPREMRNDSKVAVFENPSKKEKEVSSRGIVMGATEREAQHSASKMKEQMSSKKTGFAHSGPNLGDGVNCLREMVPVNELPQPENASLVPLEMDDWVQCEKCQKWRLLPFGTNPDSLPKEWICSMLTWLPGMNRCSVSEDETTHALRALYLPSASGPALLVQNNQQARLDGIACVKTLAGAKNVGHSNLATSVGVMLNRGKKQNCTTLDIRAARQSGAEHLHRPIKKDPQHSSGIRSIKNLKKITQETASSSENSAAAGRPSKIPKKRVAEVELSGLPKKMKKVHQQSMVSSGHAGLLPPEAKGENQNYDPDAFQISRDFVHGSSECPPLKLKNRGRSAMTAMDDEINDVSEKKRKLKDQRQSANAAEPFGIGQRSLNNLITGQESGTERKQERTINTSSSEARGSSADKEHRRTKGDVRKHNLGSADDNNPHEGSRVGGTTLEPYHTDRMSRKIADARKSSEKALDFNLSDNATTSNSSKVSTKVKVKAFGVKCSPVGTISSSPLKVCKSDPVKETDKIIDSYNEHQELSSRKQLKSRVEGACASNEFAPHNEEMKNRKSNLSRTIGVMPDAAHEDQFSKKVPFGRCSNAQRVDAQPNQEDFDCHDGKFIPDAKMSNGSHTDGTSLDRQKLHAADMGRKKESAFYSHCAPGNGSNSVRVDDGNVRHSRHVLDDHEDLRHPDHTALESKDIEASSSKRKDSLRWAVTALEEARNLKHSANRLKTAGSGFSAGLFFQAALKFLHGASLLELENNEDDRVGEMSSTEVYISTAKLCEYCGHEYEKCNDMASAALAYKCMEVAYMRVVYNNDVAASRDRLELQMVVRDASQVESPSSSASDIDNLNNQVAIDLFRDGHSAMDHRNHVISAGNRPIFARLLSYTHDMNLAMEASRRSQSAFAVANPILSQAGNEEGISSIKRVLDFSFHDVDALLHLVRLAMEILNN